MSKIIYSNYYVPEKKISAQEILSGCENISDEEKNAFLEQSGLNDIAIADKELIDVFDKLVEECLSNIQCDRKKIRYLLYTNPNNIHFNKNVSIPYYIQKKYGLDNCSILTIDQKCSTSLECLYLSKLICEKKDDEYVMILSPCFMKYDTVQDRFISFTICGDAAGILVIGNDPSCSGIEIVDINSVSDGGYSLEQYGANDKTATNYSSVDARIVTIQNGVNVIKKLLKKNGVTVDDVKLFVPQSINKYAYNVYANFLRMDKEKVYLKNIPNGGHLGDVDTIRNIHDILKNEELHKNDNIVFYGLGSDGTDINYSALLCRVI